MSYNKYAKNQSLVKTAPPQNAVGAIKQMTNDPKMLARFQNVLGQKAPQFLASVVSAVSNNKQLQKATPMSVMGAAMVAAILNLDINPSLGFSAIVPYECNRKDDDGNWIKTTEGQFQIMTKGFVQLAIRSGQYRNINVTEVYSDEFEGEDIITGEVLMRPVADGYRSKGDSSKIVGYVAYFELISGFRKTVYWSKEKILNHAKKFSKSWDTRNGSFRKNSAWDSNFEAMCRKTVLKNALSSWGILSVEMQKAVVSDQGVIDDVDNLDDVDYVDNPNGRHDEYQGETESMDKAKDDHAAEESENLNNVEASSIGDQEQSDLDDIWDQSPF